jgi:pilus assembly protein TadC
MLNQLIAERVALIEKRLPYATGFMLLALEANASLPMAVGVYCDEMEDDPLASELRIVLSDIEKGLSTQEALSGLDERVRVDLLSSFILAVNTGLATGQPLKDIMQTQAAVTRRKRYESAEEVAKQASTKATFPLVLIVLAVLLLLLGPLMLNFSESFL